MKNLPFKLCTFLLTLLLGLGCSKENEISDYVEGYIVASFICDKTDLENGQATGELTKRGFLIRLENHSDSMYTFNLQETLFDFPEEILNPNYNVINCGPIYFPNSQEYKIKFRYQDPKDSEKINFACGPCTLMEATFDWNAFKQIVIKEIE